MVNFYVETIRSSHTLSSIQSVIRLETNFCSKINKQVLIFDKNNEIRTNNLVFCFKLLGLSINWVFKLNYKLT